MNNIVDHHQKPAQMPIMRGQGRNKQMLRDMRAEWARSANTITSAREHQRRSRPGHFRESPLPPMDGARREIDRSTRASPPARTWCSARAISARRAGRNERRALLHRARARDQRYQAVRAARCRPHSNMTRNGARNAPPLRCCCARYAHFRKVRATGAAAADACACALHKARHTPGACAPHT